ncbi:hypothetical protein OAY_10245 [Vibrio cyclitrophicus ZF205]|uniref:restriction endonuclease subunit S n=1 Tax=Vibrio cyclitrophicus TaxID=47951 RepID=UPI0002F66633|nr:restriction endonuclease subunit S [Vibrio cyclitrophicus]OEE18299.1 hypothetical protein OAY_10245 [Vibrio cyclitrophicus ZF205]
MEWPTKKLSDIYENLDSKRVPITKKDRIEGPYPYYGASGVVDSVSDYLFDEDLLLVSEDGANLLARTYPIAFSISGKTWVNNHAHVLRFPSLVSQRFVEYYLNSISLRDYVSGMAQPKLNKKSLNLIPIPDPEHQVKSKVVELLDKAFADIDQARLNTEKNLRNARELFDSYLQQMFSECGDYWEETNLGAISELKNGLNYTQSSKGELVKIVGVKNFKDKFYISNDELDTVQIDGTLSEAYHAKDGDIFIVRSNGNKALIGRSVLAKGVTGKVSHSGFTIRVRLSSSAILPSYLTHYLKSKHVHNLLIRSGEGANISSLNQKALSSLPVRFPERNEQLRLVHDIEAIQSKTMALVDVYQQKLAALDELKQSLLQQAFTGQLTQG